MPTAFRDILVPHTIDGFLLDYFGRRSLHLRGDPARFAGVEAAVLARDIERTLEARVTLEEAPDASHDLLLLQLSGSAAFEAATLVAGDALYLPRGSWQAPESESSQLAFAIHNPTGRDLLQWLFDHLKRHEYFQTDVPRFAAHGVQADYLTEMRRVVVRACRAPGMIELFNRYRNEAAAPRPCSASPFSGDTPASHLIVMTAPRRLRLRRAAPDTVSIKSNGRVLRFPIEAAQLLHFLDDRAPVALSEFYAAFEPEFDREELNDFLAVLSGGGIAAVVPPGSGY